MSGSNRMWGGRFAEGPSAIMREINASIPFDKALWRQDIAASKAHAAMLGACGHRLGRTRRRSSRASTRSPPSTSATGVPEDWALEDIHMTVESRLAELIGPAAGAPAHRAQPQRPGGDRLQLWVRDAIDQADAASKRCSGRW
jgi:argininosuccinate lyase